MFIKTETKWIFLKSDTVVYFLLIGLGYKLLWLFCPYPHRVTVKCQERLPQSIKSFMPKFLYKRYWSQCITWTMDWTQMNMDFRVIFQSFMELKSYSTMKPCCGKENLISYNHGFCDTSRAWPVEILRGALSYRSRLHSLVNSMPLVIGSSQLWRGCTYRAVHTPV